MTTENQIDCPALHKRSSCYPFGDRVPRTVRMLKTVTADPMPGIGLAYIKGDAPVAKAGQTYPVWTNSHGAVTAVMEDGTRLGIRPAEFEVDSWHHLAGEAAPQHPEPIAWMVGTALWWNKEEAERDAAATGKAITPFGPMTGTYTPVEQHQGEPVAWMYTRPEVEWPAFYDKRKDAAGWEETPLYTHADPGEVERIENERAEQWRLRRDAEADRDTKAAVIAELRAQLAERDVLLREAACHATRMEPMSASCLNRIDAVLDASAEPNALPDPLGCNDCAHADCGKFDGPRQVECRAMADNACARPGASS
ncbi:MULTISPECIES: hypothetical protein [Pseudomonas]|uniref:hypothetical protein n=1 Tax=Pseudomonas TaxID=286 RepID=UPI002F268C99